MDGARGGALTTAVADALARLFERLLERCPELDAEHDPEWGSPCVLGAASAGGRVRWRPVRRSPPGDLGGLARALDQCLHPDIVAFYASYWSGSVAVRASEGEALLIQIWSEDDFERLQANLIGHALAKSRAGLDLTAFIACTDEGELMLSVDNASGAVVLENPGEAPVRTVADSLAGFIDTLEPVA